MIHTQQLKHRLQCNCRGDEKMIVSFMVAMDENRVIGKDNNLPWRLPSELQYVKKQRWVIRLLWEERTMKRLVDHCLEDVILL